MGRSDVNAKKNRALPQASGHGVNGMTIAPDTTRRLLNVF
jgi:hypothetical protein